MDRRKTHEVPGAKQQLERAHKSVSEEIVEEELLGEQLDLENLFVVKGRPGIYSPRAHKEGSRFVAMRRLDRFQKKAVNVLLRKCICLGRVKFSLERTQEQVEQRQPATQIGMKEVLNNIGHLEPEKLEEMPVDELMLRMVPDYDPYIFKPYHAEKFLKWYGWIKAWFDELIKDIEPKPEAEIPENQ